MSPAKIAIGVVMALAIATLTSCTQKVPSMAEEQSRSAQATPTGMDLDHAKKIAIDTTSRIVESIPPGGLKGVGIADDAHLLTCSGGRFLWPSQGFVTLAAQSDAEKILAFVKREWQARDGYEAWLEFDPDGTSILNIRGSRGDTYYAFAQKSGRELALGSFSPCFDLPDGNLFDEY